MMKKKWNIILITVLLLLTSVFLSACKTSEETKGQDSKKNTVSDEPIEYDKDYQEGGETMDGESSEGNVGGHEEETVIDESDDIEIVPEKESEF